MEKENGLSRMQSLQSQPCPWSRRSPITPHGSNDSLFADFDGVHIHDDSQLSSMEDSAYLGCGNRRPCSTTDDPHRSQTRQRRRTSNMGLSSTTALTYYPAPVPTTTNLSKMLHERSWTVVERRPQTPSYQKTYLTNDNEKASNHGSRWLCVPRFNHNQSSTTSYFSTKGDTASQNLEQILEASVTAPVDVFVDQAFSKDLASDTSIKEKLRLELPIKSSPQTPDYRQSSNAIPNIYHDEKGAPELEQRSEMRQGPATLIDELQIRQQRQRSRNRSAIEAFPDGVSSTLLELDTVAGFEKLARRRKEQTLCWGTKEEELPEDDLPLVFLYEDRRKPGTLEHKRYGQDTQGRGRNSDSQGFATKSEGYPPVVRTASKFRLEVSGLTDHLQVLDEEETLKQRSRRMKGRLETSVSDTFSDEVLQELGEIGASCKESSKVEAPEESLGERRTRLQTDRRSRDHCFRQVGLIT